ncbi:MAG TPA: DUF4968 domain-containing protein, partial [Vicinamibacteria bacterium]
MLSPEVVRVRFSPTRAFGRDHSYAVVTRELGDPGASFESDERRSVIRTGALAVTLSHAPFRVNISTAGGESLDEDDAELGTA